MYIPVASVKPGKMILDIHEEEEDKWTVFVVRVGRHTPGIIMIPNLDKLENPQLSTVVTRVNFWP